MISPLTGDGGNQGAVLVMVDAGVTRWPGQTLHLVWHTGPPGAGLESAGGGALRLLQPPGVLPVVRPQLVQPVPVLRQLTLYWHWVPQGGVGFINCLHLHQAIPGRRLLRDLSRQLVNLWLQLLSPLVGWQFWEILLNCRNGNVLKIILIRNKGVKLNSYKIW